MICALGQAKKKRDSPPELRGSGGRSSSAQPEALATHPRARTRRRSTWRNDRPPERRDEAAAAGGFYSSFPSRKRKQTATRRPPLPASELTPNPASQLPAHLPPHSARVAALSGDRAPAHRHTQAANFHSANSLLSSWPPGGRQAPSRAPSLPGAHAGPLKLAAFLITYSYEIKTKASKEAKGKREAKASRGTLRAGAPGEWADCSPQRARPPVRGLPGERCSGH